MTESTVQVPHPERSDADTEKSDDKLNFTTPPSSSAGDKHDDLKISGSSDDCNATATSSHPSSSDSGSLMDADEAESAWLPALARQLEFYFSPANLVRDTHLQSLRSGHDGYVPASILANFGKVTTLCPAEEDRLQAVVKAARHYSSILQVVALSQRTLRQRIPEEEQEGVDTLWAVGPRDLAMATPPPSPRPASASVQNTIILRDVHSDVAEEDVRSLFASVNACPPVSEVRLDVGKCWFVTLDTKSRDDMMNVMLELRPKKLRDEPIKARLKAAPSAAMMISSVPSPNAVPYVPMVLSPTPFTTMMPGAENAAMLPSTLSPRKQGGKKSQKQKVMETATKLTPPKQPKSPVRGARGRSKRNKDEKKQQQQSAKSKTSAAAADTSSLPPPPLTLQDSHFPALASTAAPDSTSPLLDNMDEVHKRRTTTAADAASTTTTQSSTMSTSSLVSSTGAGLKSSTTSGGYAAALLKSSSVNRQPATDPTTTSAVSATTAGMKAEPATATAKMNCAERKQTVTEDNNKEKKDEVKNGDKRNDGEKESSAPANNTKSPPPPEESKPKPVPVVALSWGRGRSFADVLKEDEKRAASS